MLLWLRLLLGPLPACGPRRRGRGRPRPQCQPSSCSPARHAAATTTSTTTATPRATGPCRPLLNRAAGRLLELLLVLVRRLLVALLLPRCGGSQPTPSRPDAQGPAEGQAAARRGSRLRRTGPTAGTLLSLQLLRLLLVVQLLLVLLLLLSWIQRVRYIR